MQVPVGTYLRHRRYGLARVLGWEHGLFPRVRLRFEDGLDRALDIEPGGDPAGGSASTAPRLSSPRAGGAIATLDPARLRPGVIRLADGGVLERVPGYANAATRVVFTIGYEGRTVEDVMAALRHHRVGVLVDIREAPTSKRHGFAKRELEAAAVAADMRYVLRREWGNAHRRGGVNARRSLRVAMTRYTTHLAPHIATAAAFVDDVLDERPAFLCYEAEPFHCHRSRFMSLVLPHCTPQPAVHHLLPPQP